MDVKSKQYVFLSVAVSLFLFIAGGITWCFMGETSPLTAPLKNEPAKLVTGTSRKDQQEIWRHKISQNQSLTDKRIENVERLLNELLKINGKPLPEKMTATSDSSSQDFSEVKQLRQKVSDAKNTSEITSTQGGVSINQGATLPPLDQSDTLSKDPSSLMDKIAGPSQAALQKVTIQLTNSKARHHLKTPDNTIPAGAFARATLLGGVDASTSINSSSDPRPVLLRVTNPGTLPRKFRSDLKGCHVLAASYGDISSERVFMRLEKLTCTERKTGELIEINVQGYVAGEDGRAGLRGTVVDRAGESMRNALVGGFFSGMGSFLSQSQNPFSFAPGTGIATMNPLSEGQIFKHGAAKGASTALERYADFYIKRAEQLQPVIQVAAGRPVDIVFTQGTGFGDSAMRHAVGHANDKIRRQQIQQVHSQENGSVNSWIPSQTSSAESE